MKRLLFLFIILIIVAGLGTLFLYISKSDNAPAVGEAIPVTSEALDSESLILGPEYVRYTNQQFLFSIEYPKSLLAKIVPENDDGATIVFQEDRSAKKNPQEKIGFQIFVTPFGEDGEVLTEERIRKDIPSATIKNPQPIILNPEVSREEEVQAMLFLSEDQALGETIEVWFVQNGYLYEVTAPAHMDEFLPKILSSWRSLKL